ncbi:MAG: hypothetical protein M1829_002858 [Trizodia sp. TS-e1964]|nr:MAG: hypothetical protein M1829_002858 [Trizodia sp. TS-e1964]
METDTPGVNIKLTIWPTLQVGAFTGIAGLLFGGVSGVIHSSKPALFAFATGTQWFALGSTFWATRSLFIGGCHLDRDDRQHMLYASAASGGITGGGIGALIRGRANVLPGAVLLSLLGGVGQSLYNYADSRHTQNVSSPLDPPSKNRFWQKIANSPWVPMRSLSDKNYLKILQDKLSQIEDEIAAVDEEIKTISADDQD